MEAEVGKVYDVVIEHWYTLNSKFAKLKKVDEDDCDWRFPDDNSELSYEWDVVEIRRLSK